ncbi:phosphatidylglycerol:prolipoprotein diacylglycerol transferase [Rhodopirellula rubra]|uniref:Phosphatidylglycerol--prolipoprotein diacylglyceryl transferase n=1 Tax=Aporhodopirellula rubra TaxID=980271 RepID=A0A7W5H7J8_9BACT|nr:prolipoprotein diacylglyceryl transferase family protein [Aporhodopirellula rubra]MBB3208509.1 phosphatidylglycerol:prolipoprotein diacylglycerol transferase [Aporhodopirellula rubra]
MRRTLFLIPHEIAGIPFFGVGWLLAALAIFIALRLVFAAIRPSPIQPASPGEAARPATVGHVIAHEGGLWAFLGLLIVFLLPRLELENLAGDPVGLPIRGYGMFLMLAAICSVSLAAWRAQRAGLGSDAIFRLAPWTFVGGLLGARIFYVVQYYQDFLRPTWGETISSMAALTQGGLVVYGGFIGGFLASAWVITRHRQPLWKLGDVIVPCIFVGLFFGRLGCLMNGCCYGGVCEPNALSVQFPPGSNVYVDQLLTGKLIGLTARPHVDDESGVTETSLEGKQIRRNKLWMVKSVDPGSLAEQAGIESGQVLTFVLDPGFANLAPPDIPAEDALPGLAVLRDGELVARIPPDQLPSRAAPVWATQIISSVMAAVMLVVLLILERIMHASGVRIDGILMLCGFIAYAVLRIVLEWVRVDEEGQFGTSLSISQWVSLGVIIASAIALVFRFRSGDPDHHEPSKVADAT